MGEHTYNTEHGHFWMKSENVPGALRAAKDWVEQEHHPHVVRGDTSEQTFTSLLSSFGFGVVFADSGDVVDIYLDDNYFTNRQAKLLSVISPFAEKNSYLVFFGGGATGCWAVEFENFGTVETSVETVASGDMNKILGFLQNIPEAQAIYEKYKHLKVTF